MKLTSHLTRAAVTAWCVLAFGSTGALASGSSRHLQERGTIKSVDASAHVLVITGSKDKAEHSFQWNDKTQFIGQGAKAGPADLAEGKRVRVAYQPGGDQPMLKRVQLAPTRTGKHATNHFRPRRSEVRT